MYADEVWIFLGGAGNYYLLLLVNYDPLRQDFANVTDFLRITEGILCDPEVARI